ncbi:MAG: DNA-directed RNA polymerase specialized sigma24 family protein, partial [Planctomycetota bacterium]
MVQATFLTAIESYKAYRDTQRLSSWLAGILVHNVYC